MTENEAKEAIAWCKIFADIDGCNPNHKIMLRCIDALEKQIPKKPLHDYCWHCPNCEDEVYWDTECGQQKFKYCHNCGQKIDWH